MFCCLLRPCFDADHAPTFLTLALIPAPLFAVRNSPPTLQPLVQAEASEVFFSVTKLFQHKDVHLRRMVYLVIKEIIPSSDEVIIITRCV